MKDIDDRSFQTGQFEHGPGYFIILLGPTVSGEYEGQIIMIREINDNMSM